MRTYGQDKVLFGTNFPQLLLAKCMKQVRELDLPPDIENKFLFANARSVFHLSAAAAEGA
jgi:predicted TIM-barrel fold metal-dependent hydrolase